tara:strand:+ start:10 stop:135 length:126 start_codon:yes stop_codon:yes gene_type:complete
LLEIIQFWERGIWDKVLMVFALQMMLMQNMLNELSDDKQKQ